MDAKTIEKFKLDDDYANNVSKFLNHLLGMPVCIQNSLFKYFCDTMTAIVTAGEGIRSF